MTKLFCNHCFKLVEKTKLVDELDYTGEMSKVCPFCGANEIDLWSVKKMKLTLPKGAKHGDNIDPYMHK